MLLNEALTLSPFKRARAFDAKSNVVLVGQVFVYGIANADTIHIEFAQAIFPDGEHQMIGLVAGCKAGTGIVLIARIVGFDIFYDESRLVRIGRDTILIVLDAEADGRGHCAGHELGMIAAAGSGKLYIASME